MDDIVKLTNQISNDLEFAHWKDKDNLLYMTKYITDFIDIQMELSEKVEFDLIDNEIEDGE